jgi:hypothetical protein
MTMGYTSLVEDPLKRPLYGSEYARLETVLGLLRNHSQEIYVLKTSRNSQEEVKDRSIVRILQIRNALDYIVVGKRQDALRVARKIKRATGNSVGGVLVNLRSDILAGEIQANAEAARERAETEDAALHIYDPSEDSLDALLNRTA